MDVLDLLLGLEELLLEYPVLLLPDLLALALVLAHGQRRRAQDPLHLVVQRHALVRDLARPQLRYLHSCEKFTVVHSMYWATKSTVQGGLVNKESPLLAWQQGTWQQGRYSGFERGMGNPV